jgi:hypothetical protein
MITIDSAKALIRKVQEMTDLSGTISAYDAFELWRQVETAYTEISFQIAELFSNKEFAILNRKFKHSQLFFTYREGGNNVSESDKKALLDKETHDTYKEEIAKMSEFITAQNVQRSLKSQMDRLKSLQATLKETERNYNRQS